MGQQFENAAPRESIYPGAEIRKKRSRYSQSRRWHFIFSDAGRNPEQQVLSDAMTVSVPPKLPLLRTTEGPQTPPPGTTQPEPRPTAHGPRWPNGKHSPPAEAAASRGDTGIQGGSACGQRRAAWSRPSFFKWSSRPPVLSVEDDTKGDAPMEQ